MSTYWGYRCKTCDIKSERYFNHGDEWLQEFLDHWPAIKEAMDNCAALEIRTWADYHDVSPLEFLRQHEDHDIIIEDEYDRARDHIDHLTCYQCKQVAHQSDISGKYIQICDKPDCRWPTIRRISKPS